MANCPVCGLRCVERLSVDCIECPEHGAIDGLLFMRLSKMARVEALIELLYQRAKHEIAYLTAKAFNDQFGSPYAHLLWTRPYG